MASAVFPGTERPPHELYDAINALRLDPAVVYHLLPANRITLRRGDAVLSFEEGTLAFFSPLDGRITGAVFAGRGHALALPRDPVEKQQMGHFLGAPVLDQEFVSAYLRFTDDTADELLRQFDSARLAPKMDSSLNAQWESSIALLNPLHTLRVLLDLLSPNPKPFFCASLEGVATGQFDVILDPQRDEPFALGQYHKAAGMVYYDIWTSHRVADLPAPSVAFRGLRYAIETSILLDNSLDASTSIRLRAETGSERILVLQLSRALAVDKVTDGQNISLAFFQNEGMNLQERSARGNNFLYVILSEAPARSLEFTLRFHYHGNVIQDAGNSVLFVGARENWYPHLGNAADFAAYDLTMRWPRKLRLVATGSKLDEREDGDFRTGHWKSDKLSVAGFNLGDYASASVASGNHSIDVYANRQLEQELKARLAAQYSDAFVGLSNPSSRISAAEGQGRNLAGAMQSLPPPSPADALKQLGREIDSSIHFYENFSGPFPVHNLSVSQIPGAFGQGWPGLLYISTFSFLPAEAQQRAGLTTTGQEHFTELVPYHEVAHQWWGNVVGWSSYRDQWINEAIADYLALLFADSKKSPDHTLHVWLARYRKQLVEKLPDASEPAAEIGAPILGSRLDSSKSPTAYQQIVYCKGAWIVHMLREMLRQPGAKNPDARFAALLQSLAAKYAYRALSTDDLQHEVEAVMTPAMDLEGGRSMEWFFAEWVRGTGIPHYRAEFTAHHTDKGYLIRGKLIQTGVPRSFIASVPLYAGGAGHNAFLGIVEAAGPETSFHFMSQTSPRKIVVDPQMTLLCTSE
ncbi:MAG TPA: M1 family aminopeptidase [Candidatus Acidoferrum sp.]|nr:M1 family aminopeptidase [Candidatus Acidoferrum sp.]